jgi:hypothetical protein
MPNFGHGRKRGIGMVVEGVVVAVLIAELVPMLVEQGIFPRGLFWWMVPFTIVTAVMTVDASRFWSFGYLGGVVFGIFVGIPIFMESGLISTLDLVIYTGITVGAIALRVKIHSSEF